MAERNEDEAPWALTGNAADPQQVEKAAKQEKRNAVRAKNVWDETFSTPWGREVAQEIIEHTGVHHTVFGPTDAWTNFKAGQQDIGHWFVATFMKANPENYAKMIQENRERGK